MGNIPDRLRSCCQCRIEEFDADRFCERCQVAYVCSKIYTVIKIELMFNLKKL